MNALYALRRARQFHAGRIAIYERDRTLTYRDFYDRVMQAANVLLGLGIKRGDAVAVWMLNSQEYLELYYATAWIGAMIVPINTRWNIPDVSFTLRDSESVLLCLDDRFAPQRAHLATPSLYIGAGPCPDGMADYRGLMEKAATVAPPQPEPGEHDIVGLFYTSGTTGGPKGVMLTHRNICANALYCIMEGGVSGDWVWLDAAPMFHLADVAFTYSTVMLGAGLQQGFGIEGRKKAVRGGREVGRGHQGRGGGPARLQPGRAPGHRLLPRAHDALQMPDFSVFRRFASQGRLGKDFEEPAPPAVRPEVVSRVELMVLWG